MWHLPMHCQLISEQPSSALGAAGKATMSAATHLKKDFTKQLLLQQPCWLLGKETLQNLLHHTPTTLLQTSVVLPARPGGVMLCDMSCSSTHQVQSPFQQGFALERKVPTLLHPPARPSPLANVPGRDVCLLSAGHMRLRYPSD